MLRHGVPAPVAQQGVFMSRKARLVVVGFVLAIGSLSACRGKTATLPTPVLTTDTFTGTIAPLGTVFHSFTVNYDGAYTDASITVNSLKSVATGADKSITIGVGFGSLSLGVCTRASTLTNPAAPIGTELPTSGSQFGPGTYCVQVFDNTGAPTVTEPLSYSIAVKHY
jgi:hypothetical protein